MRVTRREFGIMAAGAIWAQMSKAGAGHGKPFDLVLAPCNLGLRPPKEGVQPGTWRAPQVLMDAGLAKALQPAHVVWLDRAPYRFDAQEGTRVRNGQTLRTFLLELSSKVRGSIEAGRFPVVIGGDCSVLLGGLYGARLAGGRGLVHVDGHADFFHPGNYDTTKVLGSTAGMDLALASGRGEALLTSWPQIGTPLARDEDIVQIGERNAEKPGYSKFYGDILSTKITMITIQRALADGIEATAKRVIGLLESRGLDGVWVHVDLDVLDESVMPAVDSPGSPGFDYTQLSTLVSALCTSGRVAGADFAIYDPDLDSQARHAAPLVHCIADAVRAKES
jgi:arginase